MKKRIASLLVVLISFFVVSVNAAEIRDCSNDNYSKINNLSFEDRKDIRLTQVADSRARVENGVLIINVATPDDKLMNVNSEYRFDNTTYKSVGGYFSVQGSGIFTVYALATDGKVYTTFVDYRSADENPSYKPELKETPLTNIEHIATPEDSEEFYLIEKAEYAPHQVVYAIDAKGDVYTDETIDNGNFCKVANPNPVEAESTEESTEPTEKKDESILKQNIEVPIYMVAVLAGVFGIVIGFLVGRIRKKENN